MPVLCSDYNIEFIHNTINDRYYLISIIDSKGAARAKIILNINNNESFLIFS